MLLKTIIRLLLLAVIATVFVGTVTSVPLIGSDHYAEFDSVGMSTKDAKVELADASDVHTIVAVYSNDKVLFTDKFYIYSRNNTDLLLCSLGNFIQIKLPGKPIRTVFKQVVWCELPNEIGKQCTFWARGISLKGNIQPKWEKYQLACAK